MLTVSEQQHTEQALLDESRRIADMERTEDEMAAAAIAASLVDLWRDDAVQTGGGSAGPASQGGGRPSHLRGAGSAGSSSSSSSNRVPSDPPSAHRRLGHHSPIGGGDLSRSASPTSSVGASFSNESLPSA